MRNNINELELNMLNNTSKKSIFYYIKITMYYTFKVILEAVYIMTCIICSFIEIICYILTFGTATRTLKKYKRGKRMKRWY